MCFRRAKKRFTVRSAEMSAEIIAAAAKNLARVRELTADKAESTNVAVMFDGTWQKRGHKSHNRVGTAISLATGLCFEFEVLFNCCLSCSRHNTLENDEEEIWQTFHTPACERITTCSAHAMETEAALQIWKRICAYAPPLQFPKFLSDRDSTAYTAVSDLGIYGSVPVQKEDCTNHVAKRLGTGLRKLKMPRGEKLKDATIRKLQGYFQVAITSNRGSVRACIVLSGYPTFILLRGMVPAITSFVQTERCLGASTSGHRRLDSQHHPPRPSRLLPNARPCSQSTRG